MKRVREMSFQLFVSLYMYYLSIPLNTNSWDNISQTLFMNSRVYEPWFMGGAVLAPSKAAIEKLPKTWK